MAVWGYVGDYGSGKSANMVLDAFNESKLKLGKRGRPVFSNLKWLYDHRVRWNARGYDEKLHRWGMWAPVNMVTYGERWAEGEQLTTFSQVERLDRALVLLDEVEAWMHSTQHARIDVNVMRRFNQQRKLGVDIRWTAPTNGMVYNQLRDVTSRVHLCSKLPGTALSVQRREDLRRSRRDEGRHYAPRYRSLKPAHDLYNSWEIVGDMQGEGYTVGAADPDKMGDPLGHLRPEQLLIRIRKFGPAALGCARHEIVEEWQDRQRHVPGYQFAAVKWEKLPEELASSPAVGV